MTATAAKRSPAFKTRLAGRVRIGMAKAANPTKAPAMQAYMKSAMPYYGINLPDVRAICKAAFAQLPPATCSEWRTSVLDLWRGARYREERYAAIQLLALKEHARCRTPEILPMLEEMITTGAWWDCVDEISQVVGELLHSHPKQLRPVMRSWSTDPNLWKRRVSIICQLSFKRETDLRLLLSLIHI